MRSGLTGSLLVESFDILSFECVSSSIIVINKLVNIDQVLYLQEKNK